MKKKLRHLQTNHFILQGVKYVKTQNGAAYITYNQAQWFLIDRQSKIQSKHILEVFLQVQLPYLGQISLCTTWTIC